MRRRILVQVLVSMGLFTIFMILTAPKAYADNCGSLQDCFPSVGSGASVTAGVAVVITIAVLALPSLLGTTKSTPPPLGSDRDPQQPSTPSGSSPESGIPGYQPDHAPVQPPAHQPEHLPGAPVGHPPAHAGQHPGEHPPEGPGQHDPGEPTVSHPGEPTVHPPEHPVAQPPDQQPAHLQAHGQPPEHLQAHSPHPEHRQPHPTAAPEQPQEARSSQQVQATRPDEQIQVVRPEEPAKVPLSPQEQPPMRSLLYGIHHVTAITGHPQQNIDFYTGLLGLRLVKQTVNIDNPNTYHLYYGDELGRPGTVLSFMAWPGASRGNRGSGQAVAVAFSIPEGTLNHWAEYLSTRGIRLVQSPTRFDEHMFSFYDPDGLQIDMVAHRSTAMYPARSGGPIPPAYAIQGIYGVTLLEANYERTHAFLTQVLGFRPVKAAGNLFRYETGNGGPGTFLDILSFPGIPSSQAILGTIHHLAWRAPEDEQQQLLQRNLTRLQINLTQGIDPLYFPAYSFREPGGVLFEIAELAPGFTVDEPPEQLGTHLMLPPWLAHRRAELQQVLPPLRLPFTGR